jgi:hypothetical protein
MTSILGLLFLILFLAVLIWGGDRLLALLPGNEKLKQIVRIIAIVVVALWFLSLAASFFGVALPWNPGGTTFRHHR